MSEPVKKTDALEHIKELKNFEAGKLGPLSTRIRRAKFELEETAGKARESVAEASKFIEAEKLKAEAEKAKALEAFKKTEGQEPPPQAEEKPKDKPQKPAKAASSEAKRNAAEFFDKQEGGVVDAPPAEHAASAPVALSPRQAPPLEAVGEAMPSEHGDSRSPADSSSAATENHSAAPSVSEAESVKDAPKVISEPKPQTAQDAGTAQRYPDRAGNTGSQKPFGNQGGFGPREQQVRPAQPRPGQSTQGRVPAPGPQGVRPQASEYRRTPQGEQSNTSYSSGGRGGYDRPRGQFQGSGGPGQGQRFGGQSYQGGAGRPSTGMFNKDQRPPYRPGTGAPRPGGGGRPVVPAILPDASRAKGNDAVKKKPGFQDDKKALNKKALLQKGYVVEDITLSEDGDVVAGKRYKVKRAAKRHEFIQPLTKIETAVITSSDIDIKVLSEKIGKTAADIVKKLFLLGIAKTINESIDFETAELIAGEFGIRLVLKLEQTYEEALESFNIEEELSDDVGITRPPVVTILGHVDHGKTSLLDYIRKANVAEGEAGGITQHIGAYTIALNDKPITFIDTPGHEAFTAMRARGAQITDIAILVVAADDGVMPQTVEAINHAKAAGVSIIIAANKIDKPAADISRVKQQVSEHGLIPEEWGGEVPVIGVSAKSGEGVQTLLENVLTLAEFKELKANPRRAARGTVIEARLDKGRGPVATILVQNGTLRIADTIVAGTAICKVRAMIDDKGNNIKEAGPSIPVSVLGFDMVPEAGDNIFAVADEKLAKQVISERSNKIKSQKVKAGVRMSLEDVYNKISAGLVKDLNLIVKADVQGSSEALTQALLKISNPEVRVNIIHSGVGAVNESDVMLAGTSSAIIIGFNVRPDVKAKAAAERDGIDIKVYRIIYDAIEDIEKAIKGMLAPKFKETVLGQASVRQVFKVSGVGTIAGCMVIGGKMTRNAKLRLLRDNVIIHEGSVASLKRFKDDAKEVATGFECGIGITDYNDIKEGDVIEAYVMEQIEIA